MSQLLNDTKIYVSANSLNEQLSTAITNGDLSPPLTPNWISVSSPSGYGSSPGNKIRVYTVVDAHVGSGITYVPSASNGNNGDKFVAAMAGVYCASVTDRNNTAQYDVGITFNDSATTSTLQTVTWAQGFRKMCDQSTGGSFCSVSVCLPMAVNDFLMVHTDGGPDNTSIYANFTMTQVAH